MRVCVCVGMYVCVGMCVCMYVCVYVCVCIEIHLHNYTYLHNNHVNEFFKKCCWYCHKRLFSIYAWSINNYLSRYGVVVTAAMEDTFCYITTSSGVQVLYMESGLYHVSTT